MPPGTSNPIPSKTKKTMLKKASCPKVCCINKMLNLMMQRLIATTMWLQTSILATLLLIQDKPAHHHSCMRVTMWMYSMIMENFILQKSQTSNMHYSCAIVWHHANQDGDGQRIKTKSGINCRMLSKQFPSQHQLHQEMFYLDLCLAYLSVIMATPDLIQLMYFVFSVHVM